MNQKLTWLNSINKEELTIQVPPLVYFDIKKTATIDEVAAFMCHGGPFAPQAGPPIRQPTKDTRPVRKYWDLVKDEFRLFLCSDDKKYDELRDKLNKNTEQSTKIIVGIVASFIGERIGFEAGALIGFCSVCIYAASKLGKEALCRMLFQQ